MKGVTLTLVKRECYRNVWIDTVRVEMDDGRQYERTIIYDDRGEHRLKGFQSPRYFIDCLLTQSGLLEAQKTEAIEYPRFVPYPGQTETGFKGAAS